MGINVVQTGAFTTLDGIHAERLHDAIEALDLARAGHGSSWTALIEGDGPLRSRLSHQGLSTPSDRASIQWDDPTLLFVMLSATNEDGSPSPLAGELSRERFGRYPTESGSALEYLLEHLSIPAEDPRRRRPPATELPSLLKQLHEGLTSASCGHTTWERGNGGLTIRGFLDAKDVGTVLEQLQRQAWGANADEPLDGGVQDVVRHLTAHLKEARKRKLGVLCRAHA